MKHVIIYFLVVFFNSIPLMAQSKHVVKDELLSGYFSRIVRNDDDESRLGANDSLRMFVRKYAESDSVFNFTYDAKYLGQITSPDTLVKIITWNVRLGSGKNQYYCYIIHRSNAEAKAHINALSGEYTGKTIFSDTTYNASDWYGALYYAIRPFSEGSQKCWVVLGLDFGDSDVARKIIDVLSFTDDRSVLFGRKWFETSSGLKFRKVFEYASMGTMSLRFTNDTSIVFDHLAPVGGSSKTGRLYYGADYSYDSYEFSKGRWIFKLNVDARNKE